MDNLTGRDLFIDLQGPVDVLYDISSDDDSDDSGSEMPLLEPITTLTPSPNSRGNAVQTSLFSNDHYTSSSVNRYPSRSSTTIQGDTESMPELHSIRDSSSSASSSNNHDNSFPINRYPSQSSATIHADEDDNESLPELLSIGDSSSSGDDTDEVEAMQDLQPVDDDNDSSWIDSESNSSTPSSDPVQSGSSSTRNNRRARVDDDDDQDRDRRHPSQRVAGTTDSNNADQRPTPSIPFQIHIPALVRIVSTPRNGVPSPADPPRRPQNATTVNPGTVPHQHPAPRATPIFTGGFAFTVGVGGPNPRPGPTPEGGPRNPPTGPGNPRLFEIPPAMGGFPTDFIDLNMFADFMGRFGVGLGQALGLDREEPEDPERAKKLVDALEEVPVGLVRRLEQVGGAPGGHVDETAVDTPGCAICWDQLLDAEGDGFAKKTEDHPEAANQDEAVTEAPLTHVEPSVASSSSSTSLSPDSSVPLKYPKIVSLPCAHVFHASCLIPWFSRPNQTTCPTCRFNIDPENLTYVRRPNPPTQTNSQPATQNAPTTQQANQTEPLQTSPPVIQTAVPPEGAIPHTQLPTQTAPPDGTNPPTDQTTSGTPPPPSLGLPLDGDIWTFGIDLVIEQPLSREGQGTGQEQNQDQGGQEEPTNQDAMDVDNPAGMTEALAEQLLGRLGFNMANANAQPPLGNATPTPPAPGVTSAPPPPDATGQQANPPFTGLPRIFPGLPHVPVIPVPLGPGFTARGGVFTQPQAPNPQPFNVWHGFAPLFAAATGNLPQPRGAPESNSQQEKKVWSLPAAPGPTLRQRVEQKEREAGLRCCDTSCGIGPSDEEPHVEMHGATTQLHIRPSKQGSVAGSDKTEMCAHTFHPACLVSAERVAMQGADEHILEGDVEVSCPVCRAVGCITEQEWKEGVSELL